MQGSDILEEPAQRARIEAFDAMSRACEHLDERGAGRPDPRQFVEPGFDCVSPEAVVYVGAPVKIATFFSRSAAETTGLQCVCSRTVVTPATAAAADPLVKSSRSGSPGSMKWTCASTMPGMTRRPDASIVCRLGAREPVTSTMRPPST